jgi:hypothetical protein
MLKKGKDPELDPDLQGFDIKLKIRIRSKMFRIRNTALDTSNFSPYFNQEENFLMTCFSCSYGED